MPTKLEDLTEDDRRIFMEQVFHLCYLDVDAEGDFLNAEKDVPEPMAFVNEVTAKFHALGVVPETEVRQWWRVITTFSSTVRPHAFSPGVLLVEARTEGGAVREAIRTRIEADNSAVELNPEVSSVVADSSTGFVAVPCGDKRERYTDRRDYTVVISTTANVDMRSYLIEDACFPREAICRAWAKHDKITFEEALVNINRLTYDAKVFEGEAVEVG